MKIIVYIFATVLSLTLAINFSIVSMVLVSLISGLFGIVVAVGIMILGFTSSLMVFIFIKNRIIKSLTRGAN